MKDLDPKKLEAQKRQKDLNEFIEYIETMCVQRDITIGEWAMVTNIIDKRQNALLIKNKIEEYAKSNEGGNDKGFGEQNSEVQQAQG